MKKGSRNQFAHSRFRKPRISDFDPKSSLEAGLQESAEELTRKYGFRHTSSGKAAILKTAPQAIRFGGELFFGTFHFYDGAFRRLDLIPLTGIDDNYPSPRMTAAQKRICERAVSTVGERVGQFSVETVEARDRKNGAGDYIVVIRKP